MYKIDVEIISTYEANFGTIKEIFTVGISNYLFNKNIYKQEILEAQRLRELAERAKREEEERRLREEQEAKNAESELEVKIYL